MSLLSAIGLGNLLSSANSIQGDSIGNNAAPNQRLAAPQAGTAYWNSPPYAGSSIGETFTNPKGDTWQWDGARWTMLPTQLGAMNTIGSQGIPVTGANPFPTGVTGAMPYVDPMVYATETHLKQPADKRWRRFQHALFIADDVCEVYANNRDNSVSIRLRGNDRQTFVHDFALPFDCADPVQWFAEHVMGMDFPNTPHAT